MSLFTPGSGEVCRGICEHPWEFWFELAKAADKYLAPSLVKEAADAMNMHGFLLTARKDLCGKDGGHSCDVDGVCDIFDAFQKMDWNPQVFEYAERLAGRIQEHLHDSDRFRAHLLGNPKLMLRLLENETRQADVWFTGIDACEYHMETQIARTEPSEHGPCLWCETEGTEAPVERYNMWYVKCG